MSSGGWVKIKPKQTDKSRGIVLLRPGIPRSVARLLMPGAYREAGDALAVVSVALALPLRGLINLDIVYKGQVLKICYDHSIGHTLIKIMICPGWWRRRCARTASEVDVRQA